MCLLNIKKYNDKRKDNKELIFVDPGVYELVKRDEYSKISELHYLTRNNLKENELISIDYPCDMLALRRYVPNAYLDYIKEMRRLKKIDSKIKIPKHKYRISSNYFNLTEKFIQKSYFNNILYKDNLQYICTIQMNFESYMDFEFQAERLRHVWEKEGKIVGIGNMCRMMYPNDFTDKVYEYICREMQGKWVHIYGMPMRQIKTYVRIMEASNIKVSIDSTKWTKRIHKRPPLHERVCCTKATRDIFFLEYIKEIEKVGIQVEY